MGKKTIAAQLAAVRAEMEKRPRGLVRHAQRTAAEAITLATCWDVDPARAELAAWGHDLFRAVSPKDLLPMAREAGLPIILADKASPIVLHGPIAAATLESRFNVTDTEVIAAVRDHTLGIAEMPILSKIILLADKVEKRKRARTPALAPIRQLARRDIDAALLCWADWKWVEERTHRWLSHPLHWDARRRWVAEHHTDVALPARGPDFDYAAEPAEIQRIQKEGDGV